MNIRKRHLFILALAAFALPGPRSAPAQGWALNSVVLESVTKVEQRHIPGIGPNYLVLIVEGKAEGKPMKVELSVNAPGWGAQKLVDSCEKSAMLALHYPGRYGFEVVSSDTGQDGSVSLNVGPSDSDAATCAIKVKPQSLDVKIPTTQIFK